MTFCIPRQDVLTQRSIACDGLVHSTNSLRRRYLNHRWRPDTTRISNLVRDRSSDYTLVTCLRKSEPFPTPSNCRARRPHHQPSHITNPQPPKFSLIMSLYMPDDQARFLGLEVADSQPDSGSLSTIQEATDSENNHDGLPRVITPDRAEPVFPSRKPASRPGAFEDFMLVDEERDTEGSGSSVVADRTLVRRADRAIYRIEALRRARATQAEQEMSRLHHIHKRIQKWLLDIQECQRGEGTVSPTYYRRDRKQKYRTRKLRETENIGSVVFVGGEK